MINKNILIGLRKEIDKEDIKIKNRILYKNSFIDLVTDYNDNLDCSFNIEIDTHSSTNQKSTGRCWSFAGLNILREEVIKKCNLNNFELSESYIAFYDKLERFNLLLERLDKYINDKRDNYDRYVHDLLETGIDDGSTYTEFKELVKKYGVVPKSIYSDSVISNDTCELNDILSTLIRKYYLDNNKSKDKYLKDAYKVLCYTYGIPIDKFDFEYTDIDGNYHIDKGLTPLSFYKKYIDINLDNYIEIYSYKDSKYKYNNVYTLEEDSFISSNKRTKILNLDYERIEKLIIKQLKNNEMVYFSTSTSSKYENGMWIDLMSRYSNLLDIDLNMTNNEIIKTYGSYGEHSMVITGVLIDNKVKRWKVENSWGPNVGNNGYFVMEPIFLEKYLVSVVINKDYLNKKELSILNKEPIEVSKWDCKFC